MKKLIIIIGIIFSLIGGYSYYKMNNPIKSDVDIDILIDENTYDDILDYKDGIFLVKKEVNIDDINYQNIKIDMKQILKKAEIIVDDKNE